MRAVLVFCEGNHDVAFVTRSLGALAGAQWVGGPVGQLPAPLGTKRDPNNPARVVVRSVIATHYERRHVDELKLQAAMHAPMPAFETLVKTPADDTLYVMIRCGGDDAAPGVLELLKDLRSLMSVAADLDALALAFIFDADDAGVKAREAVFSRDYAACLAAEPERPLCHAQWVLGPYGPVGLFVFHDPSTGTGTLEDVLGPLVQQQWPKKWEAADVYLRDHGEPDDRIHDGPAAYKKARIGVTGQFAFPGGPMTEVIRNRSEGLSSEQFKGPTSKQLVEFLRRVPWSVVGRSSTSGSK